MMLSMFHHHDHSQHNDQEQSSPETLRPASIDPLTSSGSSNTTESSIINSDFNHGRVQTSSNGSTQSASPGGSGDAELEPQDLSLRPRRQESKDSVTNATDGYRCQICQIVIGDHDQLIRHMTDTHGDNVVPDTTNPADSSNPMPTSMTNSSIEPNGHTSNGASNRDPVASRPDVQSMRCPLCNAAVADETEFFDHFLRQHNTENGADSMSALFTAPAASLFLRNGTSGNGSASSVEEDGSTMPSGTNGAAFCELCNKEFCNKWFLKTHKAKVHGITSDEAEDPTTTQAPSQSTNGDGSHHSGDHTPKTSPTSSIDPAFAFGNPLSALPFGTLDQQQLTAFGQQNVCPFCHQFFPNVIILQSHLLAAHPGLLMNPAAAMYAASVVSANPFANGGALLQQQPQANGKNNLQQLQQQQMATIAAAAAMMGFDPMATMNPLDYFAQGMQPQPSMTTPGSTFGSTTLGQASAMRGSKLSGQQPYHGLMASAEEDKTTAPMQQTPTKSMEAYCEICQKEFCNKYFLRTHKMNKHGILDDSPKSNGASRGNLDNRNKSPGTKSPNYRLPYTNGKDTSELKRDATMAQLLGSSSNSMEEGGPTAPKLTKMTDSADESLPGLPTPTTTSYSCNLCVKTFPSMFALVAHKYRDHGTFDMTTASTLMGQNSTSNNQPTTSSSPSLAFGQTAHRPRKSTENDLASLTSPLKGLAQPQSVDLEAYCEICQKEFCSKYFLKVHKANIHGIGSVTPNSSPSMVVANGTGSHVPAGVRRSLNGSVSGVGLNGTSGAMNLINTAFKQEQEAGRRNSTNGTPSSAAAILMMAAAGGVPPGRPLVASKNFCDICNKELCNKYFLRTHMLKMHGIVIDENKTVIANINTLDKEKTGELLFRCDLCGEQLASRQQLRAHKQSVHQIIVPPSTTSISTANDNSMSSQDFQTAPGLKRESIDDFIDSLATGRSGAKEEPPENDDGKMEFSQTPTTASAIFGNGMGREVLCTICGRKYKNARCLRMHILSDHTGLGQKTTPKTGPACEYCSMEFPDHTELQLHVINEHQCEVRGSVATMAEQAALDALSNSSAFVAAVNSVANAVAEVAAAAGTTTGTTKPLESMENELETETANKPQQQQHNELPLVTRAKNGTKLFRCSYCNYYTRWISNLSTHEKRHNVGKPVDADNGEKPFKCRMCLRSYRYSHSLQRHMEMHRSSGIGLRTTATALASTAPPPPPAYHINDTGSKTPPALTPGPNGHDHAFSSAFSFPTLPPTASDQPLVENGTSATDVALNLKSNAAAFSSPSKRHHCQLCGKSFGNRELYRMHVLTIHNTVLSPEKLPMVNGSPKKYRCRQCHINAKSYDDLRMHVLQKHSTTPAYLKVQSSGESTPDHVESAEKRSDNGLDLTAKNGQVVDKKPNCVIQAFLMEESNGTGIFPNSSVVYLPVLRRLESPIEATFTLTPIGGDHPKAMENGTNGHA